MNFVATLATQLNFISIQSITHKGKTVVIGNATDNKSANPQEKLVYTVTTNDTTDINNLMFYDLALPSLVRGNGLQLISLQGPSVISNSNESGRWQVISDETYVYLFRALPDGTNDSKNQLLYANRYLVVPLPDEETEGKSIDLLVPKKEARYQVSNLKDTPANDLDKPSFRNLDGEFYEEPVMFFPGIQPVQGWYTVQLTPSDEGSTRRWLIFSTKSDGSIQVDSFLRNNDGWPDLRKPVAEPPSFFLKQSPGSDPNPLTVGKRRPSSLYFRRQEQLGDPKTPSVTNPRIMLSTTVIGDTGKEQLVCVDFELSSSGLPILPIEPNTNNLIVSPIVSANTALDFDGKAVVSIPYTPSLKSAFTYECWVRNEGKSGVIFNRFEKGSSGISGIQIHWDANARLLTAIVQNRADSEDMSKEDGFSIAKFHEVAPSTQSWHHIVFRYQIQKMVAVNDVDKVPVEGAFVIDGVASQTKVFNFTSSSELEIQANGDLGLAKSAQSPGANVNPNWSGGLDEIRLWNVMRTDEEIIANMSTELNTTSEAPASLVGYWKLDDAFTSSPSKALDSSQSKQDGTIEGANWTTKTAPVQPVDGPDVVQQFNGLSTGMGILAFDSLSGKINTAPTLISGADGLVHLYCGVDTDDDSERLGVLHYDTNVNRAQYESPWTGDNEEVGTIQFWARHAGPNFNQAFSDKDTPLPVITISDSGDRHVTAQFAAPFPLKEMEIYEGVPKDLASFVQVINGLASADPLDPNVQNGNVSYYDYTGSRESIEIPTEGLPIQLVIARNATFPSALKLTKSVVEADTLSVGFVPRTPLNDSDVLEPCLQFSSLGGDADQIVQGLKGLAKATVKLLGASVCQLPFSKGKMYFVYEDSLSKFGAQVTLTSSTTCNVMITQGDNLLAWEGVSTSPVQFLHHLNTVKSSNQNARNKFVVIAANTDELMKTSSSENVDEIDISPFMNIIGYGVKGHTIKNSSNTFGTIPQQKLLRQSFDDVTNSTASALFQAMPYQIDNDSEKVQIKPSTAKQILLGNFGGWVPIPPVTMGDFSKNQAMIDLTNASNPGALEIVSDFTFESWFRAESIGKQRLFNISSINKANSLSTGFIGLPKDYHAVTIPKNDSITGQGMLPTQDTITLYCWLKHINAPEKDQAMTPIITLDFNGVQISIGKVYIDEKSAHWIIAEAVGATRPQIVTSSGTITEGWNLVAVEINTKDRVISHLAWQNIDGSQAVQETLNLSVDGLNPTISQVILGKYELEFSRSAKVEFSELSLWSGGFDDFLFDGLFMYDALSISDKLDTLFGYWSPTDSSNTQYANRAPHGQALTLDNTLGTQSVSSWPKTNPALYCGIGQSFSAFPLPYLLYKNMLNTWTHFTASCSNSQAVKFDAEYMAVVKDSSEYELGETFSIDGRLIIDKTQAVNYLVSKSTFDNEPWTFMVAVVNSKLNINGTVVDEIGVRRHYEFNSDDELKPNTPYYFGVSFQILLDSSVNELTYTNSNPNKANEVSTVKVENYGSTTKSKIVVNLTVHEIGTSIPVRLTEQTLPLGDNSNYKLFQNSADLAFGANSFEKNSVNPEAKRAYFSGKLGLLRLWSKDIKSQFSELSQITVLPKNTEGLQSNWLFNEGEGLVVKDHASRFDATLSSPSMWMPSHLSIDLSLYINGISVQSQPIPSDIEQGNHGKPGASFGYYNATTPLEVFSGQMDEVRLWSVARSADEIRSNMFSELSGKEANLSGYWPISVGSGSVIVDKSLNGNDAKLIGENGINQFWWQPPANKPAYDSPIGNEAPQFKNLLQGPNTIEQTGVTVKSIAVTEVGNVIQDSQGISRGIIQRQYLYIDKEGALNLIPEFKVGDAQLSFIGQVQSNPTLIGYIEGPPPVPGENLTRPYYKSIPRYQAYMGVSSVTLDEDEDTRYTYSAQKDTGFDSTYGFNFGVKAERKDNLVVAPLGIGTETGLVKGNVSIGLQTNFSLNLGYIEGATTSIDTKRTLSNYIDVGGNWEPADGVEPNQERHYLMDNLGYALVKSGVANVYALKLERTNTLIGTQIVPDPQIAEDFNIIMFPINPEYTKQGTLDGMKGFKTDTDYPEANNRRGSYYKPYAAQDLEQQIDAHEASIEADYQAFNAGKKGRRQGITHFTEGDPTDPSSTIEKQEKAAFDWENNRSKRNLVNTYVWTAGGGLFSEQEQTMTSREETHSGSYSFTGMAGLAASKSFALLGFGAYIEANAMFGGHIHTSVTKNKQEGRDFSLSIKNDTEAFLAKWLPGADKPANDGAAEPGKVDAYRFKSFYLSPERDNFDDFYDTVVDPNWLAMSDSRDSFLLRQAKASKSHIWRVLHRVTYVSRVPPVFDQTPTEVDVKKKRSVIDIPQNAVLIGLVEGSLKSDKQLPPYTATGIVKAVNKVLAGTGDDGKPLNAFSLANSIPWWGGFIDASMTNLDGIQASELEVLRQSVISYMIAHFSET